MMVTYLDVEPTKDANEVGDTIGAHTIFNFLEELCIDHSQMALDVKVDGMLVDYHQKCSLRSYLLFLVGTSMFVEESTTYVNMVYLSTLST